MIFAIIIIVLLLIVGIAFLTTNKVDDTKPVYICKKCGNPTTCNDIACSVCGCNDYLATELKPSVVKAKRLSGEWNTVLKNYFYEEQVLKMTEYEHQIRLEKQPPQEATVTHNYSTSKPLTKDGTEIHCPTCGSTNIERVSTVTKAVDIWAWGLFGNKRNKQFKCNNCKYMW